MLRQDDFLTVQRLRCIQYLIGGIAFAEMRLHRYASISQISFGIVQQKMSTLRLKTRHLAP